MGGDGAVGVANISLVRARQFGCEHLEVDVFSPKSLEQIGVLSISLSCTSTRSAEPCPAATVIPAAAGPLSKTSDPNLEEKDASNSLPVEAQLSPPNPNDAPHHPTAPTAAADDFLPSPFASMQEAVMADPSAALAAMMAEMVAVAAMVAAADLPVTCSSLHSKTVSLSRPQQQEHPASAEVTLYPRIQPYNTVPPREFGPGKLPAISDTAAPFYPDIVAHIRYSELSLRLQELRPTLSAPGA